METAIKDNRADDARIEILEGKNMEVLDQASEYIFAAQFSLIDEFKSGVKDFLGSNLVITICLIGLHMLMLVGVIFIMIAFYLRRIDSEYKRLRTLIRMIPQEVLKKDKQVKHIYRRNYGDI